MSMYPLPSDLAARSWEDGRRWGRDLRSAGRSAHAMAGDWLTSGEATPTHVLRSGQVPWYFEAQSWFARGAIAEQTPEVPITSGLRRYCVQAGALARDRGASGPDPALAWVVGGAAHGHAAASVRALGVVTQGMDAFREGFDTLADPV